MTQDEIIEMGQKAGLAAFIYPHLINEKEWAQLKDFIELVAAKEREACAKLCDEYQDIPATEPRHCAQDIRARGKT